ncbi:TIGR01777 family oxidoreductase [Reinekea marina]|uniref:TIGR01777 family oxidoreductase n=1 Tax=Reinekea marina TaxID=1310421 RepID=A0ABV7WL52_9GAMM|nr:TIGR01777 family oxidoreductase [Reinekea marina]MDN3650749.1 TIGR01777 family oxidoreductase [Reinekea marina]
MNILMTGGSGFLGSAFIKHSNEHTFTILTRNPERSRIQFPQAIHCISSLDSLDNLDEFDAIINLAGEPIIDKRWTDKQKAIIAKSRLSITSQLVTLITKSANPPSVMLSGSAIGIYGNGGDEALTEHPDIKNTSFSTQLCTQWEAAANQASSYTRVVNLRTGIVLSNRQGALAKMLLPFKLNLGGRLGNGEQYMAWIHYQDYLNALEFLLRNQDVSGPVNMVAPTPEKNKEFTQTLASTLNRIALFPVPEFVLKLLLGESSCLLLDSQRVVPSKLRESGFEFRYSTLSDALSNLLNSAED